MDARRLFLVLAETGSFTEAGQRTGLARTTVMRRVAALETEVGLSLVRRSGNRVELTEVGHAVAEGWGDAYRRLDRVEEEVRAASGRVAGLLRLRLPVLGTGAGVMSAIAAFCLAHPHIDVRMDVKPTFPTAGGQDFDVALHIGLEAPPELKVRTLFRLRWGVVASPAYLERWGVPTLHDLAEHRAVVETDASGHPVAWHRDGGQRVNMPRVVASANAIGHVLELALGGVGMARVPEELAQPSLETGRLRSVLPEVGSEAPLNVLYTPDPTPSSRAFVDFMLERARRRASR